MLGSSSMSNSLGMVRFRRTRGQVNGENGAPLVPIAAGDGPAVLLDDAARNAQAEAGPGRLAADERREQLAQEFRRDTRAGVRHAQDRLVADLAELDVQPAAAGHCVEGVEEQVDEDRMELVAVDS